MNKNEIASYLAKQKVTNTKEEAIKARKEAELKYFGKYRYQG